MPRLAERLLVDSLGWSATDPTIATVFSKVTPVDGAPDASFCRSVTTPCTLNFFLMLKTVFLVGGVIPGISL